MFVLLKCSWILVKFIDDISNDFLYFSLTLLSITNSASLSQHRSWVEWTIIQIIHIFLNIFHHELIISSRNILSPSYTLVDTSCKLFKPISLKLVTSMMTRFMINENYLDLIIDYLVWTYPLIPLWSSWLPQNPIASADMVTKAKKLRQHRIGLDFRLFVLLVSQQRVHK